MKQNQVEQVIVLTGPTSDLGLELTKRFGERRLSLIATVYRSTKDSARMYFDVLGSEGNSEIMMDHFDPGVMGTQMEGEMRPSSIKSFPLQAEFLQLKTDERLKSPLSVAIQIEKMIYQ